MIHMYKDQPVGGAIPFQVIPLETEEEYEALTPAQKSDPTKAYLIEEGIVMSGEIDDNDISTSKAWSSQKVSDEIQTVKDIITDVYDATETYNIGDYCIYNNGLYICNTDSTTGTWDSSKWAARKIEDLLKQVATNASDISLLNSALSTLNSRKNIKSVDITDTNPISITGGSGNVVKYNNVIGAFAFTPNNATVSLYQHISGGVYARVIDVATKQEVTGNCQVTVYYWE